MRRLCVMNFAAWLAWFSFIYFAPDFLGVVVMGGDPHAVPGTPPHDRYDKAQTIYSASQALAAALMLSFSAVVPRLVRRFGLRRMMGASSIALATLLGAANLLRRGDEVPSFILFALTGIPWSMTMSLPYTVVSQLSSEHERGRLMGKEGLEAEETQCGWTATDPHYLRLHLPHRLPQCLYCAGLLCIAGTGRRHRSVVREDVERWRGQWPRRRPPFPDLQDRRLRVTGGAFSVVYMTCAVFDVFFRYSIETSEGTRDVRDVRVFFLPSSLLFTKI